MELTKAGLRRLKILYAILMSSVVIIGRHNRYSSLAGFLRSKIWIIIFFGKFSSIPQKLSRILFPPNFFLIQS